jgi:hypothetical protein
MFARRYRALALITMAALTVPAWAGALEVTGLTAMDTPGDGGQSITVSWEAEGEEVVTVLRASGDDDSYEAVGEAPAFDRTFRDISVEEGESYFYRLSYVSAGDTLVSAATGPAIARSNWFRGHRANSLVLIGMMFLLVFFFIHAAKTGKELYIRRIAGLSAMDEAVGRATEMGRKMIYIPGIMSLSEMQTIASLSILGHVAKQTAVYGARMEVPNIDPLTFTAAQETVKQAYMEAGKPDQYSDDMITYITYDQFAYAASVTGKMVRERPATNFLIGSFFAESLILAETGQSVGAIQIAGTADIAQLPFFVTTCDYTLLGEELYAASAYLSKEPVLLGSIKAQDVTKAVIMVVMAIGIITYAFGLDLVRRLLLTG